MIRVVSFDLDGTLVTSRYVEQVWMEGIPKIYANQHGVALGTAKEKVIGEYLKVGSERLEWYRLQHWLDLFDLKISKHELLHTYADQIEIFPEAEEVLASLSETYDLAITSNAAREFIDMETPPIARYFNWIFSTTSDFNMVKKSASVYHEVCRKIDAKPSEVVHVGDHKVYDYESAVQAGLAALYLDRKGACDDPMTVCNLREAEQRIRSDVDLFRSRSKH